MKELINISGTKVRTIKKITSQDQNNLVYLDPPYYPVATRKDGKIATHRLYNGDFLPVDFLKLKSRCDELTRAGLPFILHNSDCEFIRILFKDYFMVEVNEPRGVKEKGHKATTPCLIITNFKHKEDFMEGINTIQEVIGEHS